MLHTTSPDALAVRAIDPVHRATGSTRITAVLLIVTGAMSLAPMPILGPAISWPASLADLPARQLAAIGQAPAAVAAGYGVYLLYSLLVLPAFALAAQRLLGGFSRSLVLLVVAFAALSTLARSVGILRWLTVMPELSRAHAAADAAGRERIELIFSALNRYGGGIGELLGVSLFAAVAVLLLAAGAGWARATPRWLTAWGLFAALALFAVFLPAIGVALDVPIALAVTALSTWMWALGAWMLLSARSARPAA